MAADVRMFDPISARVAQTALHEIPGSPSAALASNRAGSFKLRTKLLPDYPPEPSLPAYPTMFGNRDALRAAAAGASAPFEPRPSPPTKRKSSPPRQAPREAAAGDSDFEAEQDNEKMPGCEKCAFHRVRRSAILSC